MLIISLFLAPLYASLPLASLGEEATAEKDGDIKGTVELIPEEKKEEPKENKEEVEQKEVTPQISTRQGGIISATGPFKTGERINVYSNDGYLEGSYVCFSSAKYTDEKTEETNEYKLFKPIYQPYQSKVQSLQGLEAKGKFVISLNPSYSILFSSRFSIVHSADASISLPRFFYPISLIVGPVYFNMTSTGNNILGGFLGAAYDLPLDYMFRIVTNLHFVAEFKMIFASSINGFEKFYYGYTTNLGFKWYFLSFMAIDVQFALSSLFDGAKSDMLFMNMGVKVGLTFEI